MTVKQNQSVFDISTRKNGTVEAVLDLCKKNNYSLTQDLSPGTELEDYTSVYGNEVVLQYFDTKKTELATDGTQAEADMLGIGTMIIGTNFDVS